MSVVARWSISAHKDGTKVTYVNTATGQTHDCGYARCSTQQALEWVLDHGLTSPGDHIALADDRVTLLLGSNRRLSHLGRIARG